MIHRYIVSLQVLQNRIAACIVHVEKRMVSNRLPLNAAKLEVFWCASNRQDLVSSDPFSVCGDAVQPAKSIRDMAIFLDSKTTMKIHVADCFGSSATDTQRSVSPGP